ncbi:hypothetical protein [Alienimonas sp. DA493]|uniref:hypothetical protein n=1 Tax=Alienimonas sp. DA493 TaxID=3373605 RepID=UPI0037552726
MTSRRGTFAAPPDAPSGYGFHLQDRPGGRVIRFRSLRLRWPIILWAIAGGSALLLIPLWFRQPPGQERWFLAVFTSLFTGLWTIAAVAATWHSSKTTHLLVAGREVTLRKPGAGSCVMAVPAGGRARIRELTGSERRGSYAVDIGRGAEICTVVEHWGEREAIWLVEAINGGLAETDEPPPSDEGPPAGVRLIETGPPLVIAFPPDPAHGRSVQQFFLLWCLMVPVVGGVAAWGGAFDGVGNDPFPTLGLLMFVLNFLFGLGGVWLGGRLRQVSHRITASPERVTVETEGVLGPGKASRTPKPDERAACVECGRYNDRTLWRVQYGAADDSFPLAFATGFDRAPREWAAEAINAATHPRENAP